MRQEHWRAELCEGLEVATCRPPSVFYFFARRTIELRIRSSQAIYLPKKGSIQMTHVLKFFVCVKRCYFCGIRNWSGAHFNSVEPSIQFTLEREKDIHLPFLDLNVSRGVRENLETKVYRKLTHTDKYLAFDSHHPICHKKSVAKTLLWRADCLPSSLNSKAEERKYVSSVLKANGFTKTFLRNCQKPVTTSSTPAEREPATGFAVIPYIQGVTEPIKRILKSQRWSCLKKPDFGAYFCHSVF